MQFTWIYFQNFYDLEPTKVADKFGNYFKVDTFFLNLKKRLMYKNTLGLKFYHDEDGIE